MSSRRPTVAEILNGQTILITGGAGLVGSVLLYRLVAAPFRPKRVITLIRGPNAALRLPKDLQLHVANLPEQPYDASKPLVVVQGDCSKRGFGVTDEEYDRWFKDVDIVINGAADIRFHLPVEHAIGTNTAMSYAMAEYAAMTPSVKTYVYLSSCFIGWFLPSGSSFEEEILSDFDGDKTQPGNNTYIDAKAIAEGITDSFARTVVKKEWAIIRLSSVSPAISFPHPAYGADGVSAPVCAWIGTPQIPAHLIAKLQSTHDFGTDIIPVEICADQILALTARTHWRRHYGADYDQKLPFSRTEPVAVYHVAGPDHSIKRDILNAPSFKMSNPYIPVEGFLRAFGSYMAKSVKFSVVKAKAAMYELDLQGMQVELPNEATMNGHGEEYFAQIRRSMEESRRRKKLAVTRASL